MAAFYGFSHKDMLDMHADDFHQYWQAITVIEAQDMLKQMKVSDHPHVKQDNRSAFHKELQKQAYPRHLEDTRNETFLTPSEIAKQLGVALHG